MKLFSAFILTLSFFLSPLCWAAISFNSVDGASASDITASTPVIFGGTAGDDCNSGTDLFSTCDSCTTISGSLKICNKTRIFDALKLRIYFQTDSIESGVAFLRDDAGNTVTLSTASTSKSKGELHSIEVTWQTLCIEAGASSSSCENQDLDHTFTIGVDSDIDDTEDTASFALKVHDPDGGSGGFDTIGACADAGVTAGGICDFRAYPGDDKIYIDQLGKSSGFPTSGNISIKALRFFVGSTEDPGNFVADPNEGFSVDLEVGTDSDGNPEITSRVIDNTSNGVLHFLRVATVDQANNVSRFTSNQSIFDNCGIDVSSLPTDMPECIFTAVPDEVLGLLEDDLNCFITSVAYNSGWDQRVDVFRNFRAQVLTQSKIGQTMIDWYYKWGPYGAVWLVKNPEFKPVVRAMLWPALGFAWVSNLLGFWITTVFTLLLLGSCFLLLRKSFLLIPRWVKNES